MKVQVNLCQKLLFLHQLTHNMTTDCSLNYKFNTWKFQAQTLEEHVVYRNCFWHSEQFLYTICSPHVLQKEELLTKIYLYQWIFSSFKPKVITVCLLIYTFRNNLKYKMSKAMTIPCHILVYSKKWFINLIRKYL